MKTVKVNCMNCGNEFEAEERYIKRGHGKFCSRKCFGLHLSKTIVRKEDNVICAYCGKKFHKSKSKMQLSKSGLYFCCRKHKDLAQCIEGVDGLPTPNYKNGSKSYRDIALRNLEHSCARCGFDKHAAALIVHHKDRNRLNNSIDNLEVLCANCHAIEHWYSNISPTNCDRSKCPDVDTLKHLLWEMPIRNIAIKYGVTSMSVRRWVKKFNLEKPNKKYWEDKKYWR